MTDAIDNALNQVITGITEEGFIRCKDKKNQESIRVMTFNRKKKFSVSAAKNLTVSKLTEEDGSLWVKVHKKPDTFYIRNEEGKLVPYTMP